MRVVYFCYPSLQVWDRQYQGPGRPQSGFGHGAEEPLVQDLNIANFAYSWCCLQKKHILGSFQTILCSKNGCWQVPQEQCWGQDGWAS